MAFRVSVDKGAYVSWWLGLELPLAQFSAAPRRTQKRVCECPQPADSPNPALDVFGCIKGCGLVRDRQPSKFEPLQLCTE